ncbi:PREDICTED: ribosomal L1 domain-containing protein 1-like [Prunus mume]|uniref:Ribosomal L1 domain-containing protein 1-like n=1 Tax=Prunus mume TaxID=102107 RepID=A0ABM0NT18_PRUMU|nr:PREDICTED: ribosomal L1 domain-containing protein 1-like [Prunus mume]
MSTTTPAPTASTNKPTKAITKTVRKAVNALLKWRNSKLQTEKPDLLESDEFAYLVLTLKKIPPKARINAYKVPLPNPLHSQLSELCLIYDDGPKSDLTKDFIQKKIKAENIPISKILKLSKLKTDYVPFEAKRKLLYSYDMFLADRRIVPLLPKYLGKQFFKKKKIPVPVDLEHKNWKEQVDKACGSALLFLSTGTCSVVRVAKVSMSVDEIVENVLAAINGIVEIVPKKWRDVRSFHLKFLESLALPVYQAVPDLTLKIEGAKSDEEVKEEVKEVVKSESKGLKSEKVSKKKGRIHEVRYMDSNAGEVLDDDELVGDGDIGEGKQSENEEPGSGELGKKKRKKEKVVGESKGDKRLKKSAKVKDDAELNGEKGEFNNEKQLKKSVKLKDGDDEVPVEKELKKLAKMVDEDDATIKHKKDELSSKGKKKDVTKKKADDLPVKGEESVGKKEKRKSEHEKLKSGEAKLKTAKRSKKATE